MEVLKSSYKGFRSLIADQRQVGVGEITYPLISPYYSTVICLNYYSHNFRSPETNTEKLCERVLFASKYGPIDLEPPTF